MPRRANISLIAVASRSASKIWQRSVVAPGRQRGRMAVILQLHAVELQNRRGSPPIAGNRPAPAAGCAPATAEQKPCKSALLSGVHGTSSGLLWSRRSRVQVPSLTPQEAPADAGVSSFLGRPESPGIRALSATSGFISVDWRGSSWIAPDSAGLSAASELRSSSSVHRWPRRRCNAPGPGTEGVGLGARLILAHSSWVCRGSSASCR